MSMPVRVERFKSPESKHPHDPYNFYRDFDLTNVEKSPMKRLQASTTRFSNENDEYASAELVL